MFPKKFIKTTLTLLNTDSSPLPANFPSTVHLLLPLKGSTGVGGVEQLFKKEKINSEPSIENVLNEDWSYIRSSLNEDKPSGV